MSTTLVAMIFSSIAIISYQEVAIKRNMVKELETVADLLGANSAVAIRFNVPSDAEAILSSVKAKPNIVGTFLYSPNEKIFAKYLGNGKKSILPKLPLSEGHNFTKKNLTMVKRIIQDGDFIGIVCVMSDLKPLKDQRNKVIITTLLILFTCSFLALIMSLILLRVVSKPISSLISTANNISQSKDYSLRAIKYTDDDLGKLTEGFNNMLNQIELRDVDLKKTHDELKVRLVELDKEKNELKKSQEREKELQDKLSRSQRLESLGLLAGGVAHDLNNLLGPVVGYPDLILQKFNGDQASYRMIEIIRESAKKAAGVIQNLLTLGRRGSFNVETVYLNEIIESYIDDAGFEDLQNRCANLIIEKELDADVWPILGSVSHLTQVIMNLAINAVEAMENGGILTVKTERVRVTEAIDGYETIPSGEYTKLTVMDTGKGIDLKKLGRIFEPFYTSKSLERSGSGLGLAVVYGVIKDLKGLVDVKNRMNGGAKFELYFPPMLIEKKKKRESTVKDFTGNEKILVVDDVKEQRELATIVLQSLGYSTDDVINGHKALKYLETNDVDLVILDMIMEENFDGLDTYKAILKINPKQKCIIASGFSESERVKEALSLGAGNYVAKPYTLDSIGKAIREELDRVVI